MAKRLAALSRRAFAWVTDMKGIIFTEFFNFIEAKHGDDFVDDLLFESGLNAAIYTSVGTYEFSDLAHLVGIYCQKTSTPAPVALHAFGHHLAGMFQTKFRHFYDRYEETFELLQHVDDHIHVEVRKLYPDAQLPKFRAKQISQDTMILEYQSCRPLADVALGLIEGSAAHFGQRVKATAHPVANCDNAPWMIEVRVA